MTLADHQAAFTADVCRLILYTNARRDLRLRLGECQRDPRIAKLNAKAGIGVKNSLHIDRLAIDADLEISVAGGPWILCKDSSDYEELGAYWKSLDRANRWGGDFRDKDNHPKPDGRHFSRSPDGIRA